MDKGDGKGIAKRKEKLLYTKKIYKVKIAKGRISNMDDMRQENENFLIRKLRVCMCASISKEKNTSLTLITFF
jgi:hypothetical protein